MEGKNREVTAEQLVELVKSQKKDFIIHIEQEEEEIDAGEEPVPA